MKEKHWVDDNHYRTVSDDGKESYLYEANTNPFVPDKCIEIAEHHSDGTTDAYEADNSVYASLFWGGKGKKK